MKAFVAPKYGTPDVLELREVEKPAPQENEILVKVHAASVNAYDWHLLTADIFLVRLMGGGMRRPGNPYPGADLAGVVDAVGSQVTQFKPGDAVYGERSGNRSGSFSEYALSKEKILAPKPANLSFEQAAAVPMAAVTALQGLRDVGKIQSGQKVLVYGAAGGVGTFTVQLAKYFGGEVTAVCSTRNLEQSRTLGADHVVDYTKEDVTQSGQQFDLILAVNGNLPLSAYKRILAPKGIYVMAGGKMRQIFEAMLLGSLRSEKGGRTMTNVPATMKQADLVFLTGLLKAGQLIPVIDRRFPFSETPEAVRYLGAGHARGKIVINVSGGAN